jgi:hypothetical protein
MASVILGLLQKSTPCSIFESNNRTSPSSSSTLRRPGFKLKYKGFVLSVFIKIILLMCSG